jgi:spermidine/putrescine transport system ATP-binding protein
MDSSIVISNVSVTFGDGANAVNALDQVSLEIRRNEYFTLLGPSGCGKTTLLRCIAGFEIPTHGSIRLDGVALEGLPPFKRPVNTVFQSYALFPHLTVAQNIAFGLEERRISKSEIATMVGRMLELVKLSGYGARKPVQLSGGQQQRVALARALANNPKVLLLDESLSALDLKLRQEMRLELKRLQRDTGITFVFVTHDQDEALTMSDRVAVMRSGRVAQIGTPSEIYDHPRSKYVADFIGDTNFLTGTVQGARLEIVGGSVPLPAGLVQGSSQTVAVCPERLRLVADGGDLRTHVTEVVYMGNDTMYHLANDVRVRVPNNAGANPAYRIGAEVGLIVPLAAVQPLEDAS